MNLEQHRFDGRIRYRYPTPIAAPYRMSRIAHTPDVRLAHLLGTIDETVRFICFVMTADYLAATREAPDPVVEGLMMNLQRPTTESVLELVSRLASTSTPRNPFVPEFRAALRSPLADELESLVADASAVRIERNLLGSEDCDAWNRMLGPRVDRLLAGLSFMEQLLLVRCERVHAPSGLPSDLHPDDGAQTWHLQGWRGVGNARPMLVRAATDAFPPERTVLLMRPDQPDALRLDPFLVPGGDARLLTLTCAPEMVEIVYGHYPSGHQVIWDVPLGRVLAERGLRKGRIPLALSETSAARLREAVLAPTPQLPGYAEAIRTTVDDQGEHFRAVDVSTGTVHSVVRVHPHRIRDESHLHELIASAEQLRQIRHPNIASPDTVRFDSEFETLVTGTLHPPYGRLIDRMPAGAPLPVAWSVAVSDAILLAMEALAERGIQLSTLPAWAVSLGARPTEAPPTPPGQSDIGSRVQVVPFLAGTGGRISDSSRLVCVLLYQMLTGTPPDDLDLEPHIVRSAVPESLSRLVMDGLQDTFDHPRQMRLALRGLGLSFQEDNGDAFAHRAVERAFAHLQRLRPGTLLTLEEAFAAAEVSDDRDAVRGCAQRLIDAHWDPDERLMTLARLLQGEDVVLPESALQLVQNVTSLADDHLPTLLYVAREAGEVLRSPELVRLRRRIMEAAQDLDDLAESAAELAQLCETRGELDEADHWWARLTEVAPEHLEGWLGRVRVARILDVPTRRAEHLEAALARLEPGDTRHALATELAQLRAVHLADIQGALETYNEVISHPNVGADAWITLRDLAREAFDHDTLIRALHGVIGCVDSNDEQRFAAQLELVTLVGLRLGRPREVEPILSQLVEEHARNRAVMSTQALFYERSARWLDAAAALEAWAASEVEPWCLGLALKRLARLTAEQLDDPDRAADLYQGVLETAPDDREALEYLEAQYRGQERWEMLEPIWATQVDLAHSAEERLDALERLARLQDETLQDSESAYRTYETILREDPTRVDHLDRFVSLSRELSDDENARKIIDLVVPHLEPAQSGEWRRRGLGPDTGDLFGSVEFFRERIQRDASDPATWKGLAKACERIGAWGEQAEALLQLAKLTEDDSGQVELLMEIAAVQRNRVLDHRAAVTTYRRILTIDPEHVGALEGLCAVGEIAGVGAAERVGWLKRWIGLCADPGVRLQLLESLVALSIPAGVPAPEVVTTLQSILELDPANPMALGELENRFRHSGDQAGVVSVLRRRLEVAPMADRLALMARLVNTQLHEANDPDGAADTLLAWVDEGDTAPVTLDLLEDTLQAAGRHQALVDQLRRRVEQATSPDERAELTYREALVRADHLGQAEAAQVLMEQVVNDRPGHLGALGFLGEAHVAAERWNEAHPVLEGLVRALDRSEEPPSEALEREAWASLALVREKLGHDDRAAGAWERVLSLETNSLRALAGLARVAWNERDYETAERYYRRLLDAHEANLGPAELAEVQGALGELALARGDDDKSRELLEQALEGAADRTELLRELVQLCERQEDWPGVVRYRVGLLETIADPLERFSHLIEIAETAQKANDLESVFRLLSEARRLRPDSVAAAVPLLDVAMTLGHYPDAVEILFMLLERESDPQKKARYYHTLGLLHRDKLHEHRKAVAYLNQTLDHDPTRLEAFEDLDRILVQHKDWEGQAQSYHAMLDRIAGTENVALEYRLYRNMARIHEKGLRMPDKAMEYLSLAIQRRPDDVELRRRLAKMYEARDPSSSVALDEYRLLLRVEADDVELWQAIGRIFARQRRRDAVWCACGVLNLLGQIDPNEAAFYGRHQQSKLALRRALAGDSDWERFLYDERHDVLLGRLFEWLARVSGSQFASRSLADLGLTPRDRVSLREKSRFTNFLGTVSKILQVPIPGVYRSTSIRGIRKEPLYPPAMLVGPEVLTGRKGKELRFLIGKAMSYFAMPHLLAGMYPPGHLRTMVAGALRIVRPDMADSAGPGVRGIQKQLEEVMRLDDRQALETLANDIIERGTTPDVGGWLRDVERAANRAGHLLANDIDVSVRMLKEERQSGYRWSDLTLEDAVQDLARYQVSERYLALRQEVGAAVPE